MQLSTHPVVRPVRLLDQLRDRIRYAHYSPRTEKAYVYWVRRFVKFHGLKHPRELGSAAVVAFLTDLVKTQHAAASTHRQALAALLFLYREVLSQELPWMSEIGRPARKAYVPVVLSREEVARLLNAVDPEHQLIASLLYGAGLRIAEGLELRVKDLDFDRGVIIVRSGKGHKDRVVMLPKPLVAQLRVQLSRSHAVWELDRRRQLPGVFLPDALASKYPRAGVSWAWHWVFPAPLLSTDLRSGQRRRHHLHPQRIGRALSRAARAAQIPKHVTAHTLRHSFATHLLDSGVNIRRLQELPGHYDVNSTMIYTHVLGSSAAGTPSPLELIGKLPGALPPG
jgi:integron integrase